MQKLGRVRIKRKYCWMCGTFKDASKFNKNRSTHSGLQSYCNMCRAEIQREYRSTPEGKARDKRYEQSEKKKAVLKRYRSKLKYRKVWMKTRKKAMSNPNWWHKNRCHGRLTYAIRTGKIKRPVRCSVCKIKCKPQGHHEDYDKPLVVVWLCAKCHKTKHQGR